MAPILKGAGAPVAPASATGPASTLPSPSETPARPQPVAIEIPVTINGARTVEGSDKREPFSEKVQTVLVFSHGAVIRTSTPLVPGQLLFLTNEKTKNEVVCQVIKSKGGGPGGAYVELQFTAPAPGFWGLRMAGAPAATPAPPQSGARPVAPLPAVVPTEKPAAPPPPAPVAPPQPTLSTAPLRPNPAAPVRNTPPVPPASPPGLYTPEEEPLHKLLVPDASAAPLLPSGRAEQPASVITRSLTSTENALPPLLNQAFSEDIEELFTVNASPVAEAASPTAASEKNPALVSSAPSTEELKHQATLLQAKFEAMHFTKSEEASPIPSDTSSTQNEQPSLAEARKSAVETSREESRVPSKVRPISTSPARKPSGSTLSTEEEMKIPSWLAPLSQDSKISVVPEPTPPIDSSATRAPEPPISAEEPRRALASSFHRPEAAVFGGQLLGESSAQDEAVSPTGSKKILPLALATAAILLLGVGGWYFRQDLSSLAASVSAKSKPASSGPPQVVDSPVPAATSPSKPAAAVENAPYEPTPSRPLQSVRDSAVISRATPSPTLESKNPSPSSRTAEPVESPQKPALGTVHLAAPVVNRGAASPEGSEPVPSIDSSVSSTEADALAATAAGQPKEPTAPIPVGGDVKPAQLLKSVPPIYPAMARNQRISGNVQIDALVDESGNVAAVKVLSGPVLLHRAALDAVKQWKYSPALLDGKPTSMHLTVTVQFRAQ